jgi:hypothetical protein
MVLPIKTKVEVNWSVEGTRLGRMFYTIAHMRFIILAASVCAVSCHSSPHTVQNSSSELGGTVLSSQAGEDVQDEEPLEAVQSHDEDESLARAYSSCKNCLISTNKLY